MRAFLSFGIAFLCFNFSKAEILNDTLHYEIRYSKKELKKEVRDIQLFSTHIKEIEKTRASGNLDYLNVLLEKSKTLLQKELQESSARISSRSIKMVGQRKALDSTQVLDLPKGYNSDLVKQQQPVGVSKDESIKMRTEAEILSKYGKIAREQQQISLAIHKLKTLDSKNVSEGSEEWISNLKSFYHLMKEEVLLMKRETGKTKIAA